MSNNDLKARVLQLNASAKRLNAQRQQDLGRQEALKKQVSNMLSTYNEKYGTNIKEEDIDTELERVEKELEKEVSVTEGIINAIEAGDYRLANQLAGVKVEEDNVDSANADYMESVLGSVTDTPVQTEVHVAPQKSDSTPDTEMASESIQQSVSPLRNPVNISSGAVGGGSIFSRDFSQQDDKPLAPPPSLDSLLGGN